MNFASKLSDFTAAEIIAALGCKRQTAYAWLEGSRQPPEWQQDVFLAIIRRYAAKQKPVK